MIRERKPEWLKISLNTNENYRYLKERARKGKLVTVCEEARCPNIHECWGEHRTATVMILGEVCTRRCRFCAVKTGLPQPVDPGEPRRVAELVKDLSLRHVVITMVDRDDLKDGGASVVVATVNKLRSLTPDCRVELLLSDFMGRENIIRQVSESAPEVISHNIETIERLTPQIRSRSEYHRSLQVLSLFRKNDPQVIVKSSMMLGLGETKEEILHAMDDLLRHHVQIMNLGQYLQPTSRHIPVQKYWHPDEFAELRQHALDKGFIACEAGAMIRSSYHAHEHYEQYRRRVHPLFQKKLTGAEHA